MFLRNNKGFTLIEVLVAIVVLAVGLVLVAEAMGRTQQAMRISENLITASRLAEEKVTEAELDVLQYHKLQSSSADGTERFPGRQFVWRRTIAPFTHSTIEDETKANIVLTAVEWREGRRKNQLDLSTVVLNQDKKGGA